MGGEQRDGVVGHGLEWWDMGCGGGSGCGALGHRVVGHRVGWWDVGWGGGSEQWDGMLGHEVGKWVLGWDV